MKRKNQLQRKKEGKYKEKKETLPKSKETQRRNPKKRCLYDVSTLKGKTMKGYFTKEGKYHGYKCNNCQIILEASNNNPVYICENNHRGCKYMLCNDCYKRELLKAIPNRIRKSRRDNQ